MADRAISQEALLQGLRDIHLPPEIAGGGIAQMLAALAMGLGFALIIGGILRVFSMRPKRVRPVTLNDRVIAARDLPSDAQQVALLHLLKDASPERYQALSKRIYQKGGIPAPDVIEQELRVHA